MRTENSFHFLEGLCFFVYLLGHLLWATTTKKKKSFSESKEMYFLAGRKLTLPFFVTSLVSTWYGGVFGVGEAYYLEGGWGWLKIAFPYSFFALILAWWGVPHLRKRPHLSLPISWENRWSKKMKTLGTFFLFAVTHPAPYLGMLGLFFQTWVPIPLWLSLLGVLLLSFMIQKNQGLQGLSHSNAIDFFFMFAGFGLLFWFSRELPSSPFSQNIFSLSFLMSQDQTAASSWIAFVTWFFLATWTFVDPGFYQRIQAAGNQKTARIGLLLAVFCWLIFDYLAVHTAVRARELFPTLETPGMCYALLAQKVLPRWVLGFFYCSLFAIIFSTWNSFSFLSAQFLSDLLPSQWPFWKAQWITSGLAFFLVLLIPSALELWWHLGNLFLPSLLFGLFASWSASSFFSEKRVSRAMVGAGITTCLLTWKPLWWLPPFWGGWLMIVMLLLVAATRSYVATALQRSFKKIWGLFLWISLPCLFIQEQICHASWIPIPFITKKNASCHWKVQSTAHFELHFPAPLAPLAELSAQYLEEAHACLSPLFKWTPPSPVSVFLVDQFDDANGMAAASFRLGLLIRLTPPESWTNLGALDNWLRSIIFHEYTHFLNLDSSFDFWQIVRSVTGPLLLPNNFWPPWMLEGLAVFMETRWSRGGRGRSVEYENMLRLWTIHEQFPPLEKIALHTVDFPQGDVVYQMGYHLMHFAEEEGRKQGQANLLGTLSQKSATQNPLALNTLLEQGLGKDWKTLWKDWREKVRLRITEDLQRLKTQGNREMPHQKEALFPFWKEVHVQGFALSPDQKWLAYGLSSPEDRPRLYLKNQLTGETQRIDTRLGGFGMSFTPDSRFLIYSTLQMNDPTGDWSDLRAYSIQEQTSFFLSQQARMKDPHVSPDGKKVIFTQILPGKTGLGLAILTETKGQLSLASPELLWEPLDLLNYLSDPQWDPEGHKIYFSLHPSQPRKQDQVGAEEEIWVYDVASKQAFSVIADGHRNSFPSVDRQGRLYFLSDREGIRRVYQSLAPFSDASTQPITHFFSDLTFSRIQSYSEKNTLYATLSSLSGTELIHIKESDLSPKKPYPTLSSVAILTQPHEPFPQKIQSTQPLDPKGRPSIKSYSPFSSLFPRGLIPWVRGTDNAFELGTTVLGWDALQDHQYEIEASYQTSLKAWNGFLTYHNQMLSPWMIQAKAGTSRHFFLDSSHPKLFVETHKEAELTFKRPFAVSQEGVLTPQLTFQTRSITRSYLELTSQLSRRESVHALAGVLSYASLQAEQYALSVHAERGLGILIGSQILKDSDSPKHRALITTKGEVNFPLGHHVVLNPRVQALCGSHFSLTGETPLVRSSMPNFMFHPFSLTTRGYPLLNLQRSWGIQSQQDLFFPLLKVFEGWSTYPLFLRQIGGLCFIEETFFQKITLVSSGLGLQFFPVTFYKVPLKMSLEWHYGWKLAWNGGSHWVFQLETPL